MCRFFPRPWLILLLILTAAFPGQAQSAGAAQDRPSVEVAPQARIIPGPPDPAVPVPPDKAAVPAAPAGEKPAPGPAVPPVASGQPRQPQAAFDRAVIAYKAGAVEDARREFLAIAAAGNLSAALAHNLGNIEFRRGDPGQAALWYRRALVLQPFSPETLQNLRTLRRQQAFLSFDPLLLSISHLNPRWISQGTVVAAWLAVLLLVWLVMLPPRPGLRWPLVTLLALVLPVLALGAVLTWQIRTDPHPLTKRLVVSGKETLAYAAPAEASSTIIALPAGSELLPLEVRGNWTYCIIPGGEGDAPLRGWVRTPRTEPLWPWSAGQSASPATPGASSPDPSAA